VALVHLLLTFLQAVLVLVIGGIRLSGKLALHHTGHLVSQADMHLQLDIIITCRHLVSLDATLALAKHKAVYWWMELPHPEIWAQPSDHYPLQCTMKTTYR